MASMIINKWPLGKSAVSINPGLDVGGTRESRSLGWYLLIYWRERSVLGKKRVSINDFTPGSLKSPLKSIKII